MGIIVCLINIWGAIASCIYINNAIAKEYKLHVWIGVLLLIVNLSLLGIHIIRFINSI